MKLKKIVTVGVAVGLLVGAAAEAQARLVMGLIPAESNEEMIERFEPMREYLEEKTGEEIKVFTATDYAGVIEAMRKKRVDIAWFGPLSYVLAEREAGAEAFAVGVRKSTGKSSYRSLFLVPGDSPVESQESGECDASSLDPFKGKSAAFVDPASTSGGLVPTYLVKKATGAMPKDFFGKLTYAGSHDAAEMAIKNKTVDIAADNDITYPKMIDKGLVTEESNRVLCYSNPLPGSPLTYRGDISEELKGKIRDAILNAHNEIEVTGYGELSKYDPTSPEDYQQIRDLVTELGLSRDDILK